MLRYPVGCFVLLLLAGAVVAEEKPGPVDEATLRQAVTKPIRLIQKSQETWYKKDQTCTSCHHQVLPILVMSAARERSIAFDADLAHDVVVKSFSDLKDLDAIVQGHDYIDEVDEAWKLIAARVAGVPPNLSTSARAQFLASAQRPDGSWYTMDARPPQSYGRFTTTALCARAIHLCFPPSLKDQKQAVLSRARDWLLRTQPRTTEERTFQLLGLSWTGADRDARQKAAKQLLAERREDGGWSQMPGATSSDAYSTGQVLYALHQAAGLAIDDPDYQRGLRFLLRSQQPDGSWRVDSRLNQSVPVSPKYFNAGFPHGRDHQFISIMGTSWATLAILQAIPVTPGQKKETPALPDLAPAEKDDWVRVSLEGSAAELKKALEGGMKPNVKTARGTTALMLAARDPEKVRLLIKAGADVNARAESGYNALTVAARYHGNAEVVRLLLKETAKVKAEKNVKVKNNASALFFAAANGDVEMARALIDARAAIEAEMLVLGRMPMSPLMAATLRGDSKMVEYLIVQDADPNRGEDMPLARAVINNHADTLKLLLAKGAKVNRVDDLGMTPLLYAASVSFGDTTVVEMLLAAGADQKVKDKKGRTALDLARIYKHTATEAVLSGKAPPR